MFHLVLCHLVESLALFIHISIEPPYFVRWRAPWCLIWTALVSTLRCVFSKHQTTTTPLFSSFFYLSVYKTYVFFVVTGYSSREHLQDPSSVPKTRTRQKVRHSVLHFCNRFLYRVKTTDPFYYQRDPKLVDWLTLWNGGGVYRDVKTLIVEMLQAAKSVSN